MGSTFTQLVSAGASPNGYRLAVTPVPTQAYATPQVVNGFVVGGSVTSGGSGYLISPTVTIVPNGSGSNATAVATVSSGVVTGITITDAGIGYTNMPTIVIDPPPANALWPMVIGAMQLNSSGLSPYDNYQLEFTPFLGTPWASLGSPFTPTSTIDAHYVSVGGATGFFRVKYAP